MDQGPTASPSGAEIAAGEDRRGCPRLSATLRVEAAGVNLATTNVSTSGMQLSCPGLLFGLLQPALERGTLDAKVELGPDVTVTVRCGVVYVAHYGYEYLLGARFVEFEGDGFELFRRYCLEGDGTQTAEPHPSPDVES